MGRACLNPMSYRMRLDGISACAPERVWTNRSVAARLRLERMRLRAAGDGPLGPDEAKLFETSDRWVRRGDGRGGIRDQAVRAWTPLRGPGSRDVGASRPGGGNVGGAR